MEEESEVLDWGNEDDELQLMSSDAFRHLQKGATDPPEDTEDAVSLGSHDDELQDVRLTETVELQETPRRRSSQQKLENQDHFENSSPSHRSPQHQHSPHRRSHSFSKITHALPPKPVVSHVPFVQPFDPSIISATAMSRRTDSRDKKANGKPTSPGDSGGEPLPPDWEVRQSRSGNRAVYYYNTRTHESTWSRPVIIFTQSQSSAGREQGRSQESNGRNTRYEDTSPIRSPGEPTSFPRPARDDLEPPPSKKDLSYDDRHYRPGGELAVDSSKRDERPIQRSYTPPPSPPRGRREDPTLSRDSRTRRHSSVPRATSSGQAPSRDFQRDNSRAQPQVSASERRWGPPPAPLEATQNRRPVSSDLPSPTTAVYEDYRKYHTDDGDWSSSSIAHRHRSPPLHYERETQSSSYAPQVSQASVPLPPRQNSRFDRPSNPPPQDPPPRLRDHDVYFPDATPSGQKRDREPELTSAQVGAERGMQGKRGDSFSGRKKPAPPASSSSVPVDDRSASRDSSSQTDQSRQRKRDPLPPQSARFHEASTRKPPVPSTISTPLGPRDGGFSGIPQGPTNMNSSNPPSGPRHHHAHVPVRDANHVDFARGSRIPPSGPSAAMSNRHRAPPRASHHSSFAPDEPPHNATADPNRAQPSRLSDTPIMANSGMYADREQLQPDQLSTDVVPRGPRALRAPPVASPVLSRQELASGRGERSPPPHLGGKDGWDRSRNPLERAQQHSGAIQQQERHGRRPGGPADQSHNRPGPALQTGRNQERQDNSNNRRHSDMPHPPPTGPGPRLSGTNSVPIGSRQGQLPGSNAHQAIPSGPSRFGPVNAEPARSRRMRVNTQLREPQQQPNPSSVESPMDTYRPGAIDGPDGRRRRSLPDANAMSSTWQAPSIVDGSKVSPSAPRSRPDTYYGEHQSRFDQSAAQEHSTHRAWGLRDHSPVPLSRNNNSYNSESEYNRAATPPPLSREPSLNSASMPSPAYERRHSGRPDNNRQNRFDDGSHRGAIDGIDARQRRHDAVEHHRTGSATSLEGRLGDRYEGRYTDGETYRPPSPSHRREHDRFIDNSRRPPSQVDSRAEVVDERRGGNWSYDDHRQFEGQSFQGHSTAVPLNAHADRTRNLPSTGQEVTMPRSLKPAHTRQMQRPDDHMDSDVSMGHVPDRRNPNRNVDQSLVNSDHPHTSRRGGSLLDRLSFDTRGSPPSSSLRERVQIPSKRDREDMMMDGNVGDVRDVDEAGASDPGRKVRRRNTKPKGRRGRNGGL